MEDDGFTFPVVLPQAQPAKVPLTARSTVTQAGSGAPAAPVQVAQGVRSELEHRNKGDPFLTRALYGLISWLTNVPLEKGYSQVDWLRVSRSTPTPRLRKDITMAEVRQHRTKEDAWMVFRNRVYNITPYLRFHPGGVDILMKAAGRDGTSLFMKYHPWVNIDALMEKCLVGLLAPDEGMSQQGGVPAGEPRTGASAGPSRGLEDDPEEKGSQVGGEEDRSGPDTPTAMQVG